MKLLLAVIFVEKHGAQRVSRHPDAPESQEYRVKYPNDMRALRAIIDIALEADPWTALQMREIRMRREGFITEIF